MYGCIVPICLSLYSYPKYLFFVRLRFMVLMPEIGAAIFADKRGVGLLELIALNLPLFHINSKRNLEEDVLLLCAVSGLDILTTIPSSIYSILYDSA